MLLVLYDAGKVTIMDMDGKASSLKFTELSPADRDYVSQHAPTPLRGKVRKVKQNPRQSRAPPTNRSEAAAYNASPKDLTNVVSEQANAERA